MKLRPRSEIVSKGKVVLISLYDPYSFSVLALSAVLEKAGFESHSIYFKATNPNMSMPETTKEDITVLIELIQKIQPIFIGISLRSTNFKVATMITKEVKKHIDAPIIWGGIHPTIRPEQCIEIADIVCIGEGDEAIVDLAEKSSKGEPIDTILNLWVKQSNTTIKNELRPLIQNLDELPIFNYLAEHQYMINGGTLLPLDTDKRTSYQLMTSRGCPFGCTFCCNNVLRRIYKSKGKYVRRRSVEHVMAELIQAKKDFKNLEDIRFIDDVFTFDMNWIREFCQQYKTHINIPFHCLCHPKTTTEEMIAVLKDAGLIAVIMGIQSGSENFKHEYYQRNESNDEVLKAAVILNRFRIACYYDIIMDNPLETEESKRDTFNLLLKLPKPYDLHIFTLTHFPETTLTNMLLEKKLITNADVEDEKQKSTKGHFCQMLDMNRGKVNLFWDNLFYLAKYKYVPRRVAVWLSYNNYLKANPKKLTFLLRLTSMNIYTTDANSKLDTMRMYLILLYHRPQLLFEANSWISLWKKIDTYLRLGYTQKPRKSRT